MLASSRPAFAIFLGVLSWASALVADYSIPHPAGYSMTGHFNNGNALFESIFSGYAITGIFVPLSYSLFAIIAYKKLRIIGVLLLLLHYLFAAVVTIPNKLTSDPLLLEKSQAQMDLILSSPGFFATFAFPWVAANLYYIWRVTLSK